MKDQLESSRDETPNEPLKILDAAKVADRSVNRLLKLHEAAQLELRDLEADFQSRLQESILKTEEKLKQRFAEEQEQKIKQTEEDVRKTTTRELLERFEVDFQKLSSEFEGRQKNAIAEAQNAAGLRLKEVLDEAERAKEGLKADFQCRLQESIQQTEERLKQGFADEQEQKIRQAEEDVRKATTRELLSRFQTEMEQLKAGFEDRRLKITAATEAAAELRFAEKIAAAIQDFQRREQEIQETADRRFQKTTDEFNVERKEFQQRIAALEDEIAGSPKNAEGQHLETTQAARSDTRDVSVAVKAEIARIESRAREISGKIDDPSTDLSTQIRSNRERSELEAYLKGLRYSLGEIMFDKSDVTGGTTL